jgi:hypothetical protein
MLHLLSHTSKQARAERKILAELDNEEKRPNLYEKTKMLSRAMLEPLGVFYSIPPYPHDDEDFEITFTALGLSAKTVDQFYKIFYKMNRSQDGEVSILEFMNFFNFNRTVYVAKAFLYCDTVGGGEMDFLEFIVSGKEGLVTFVVKFRRKISCLVLLFIHRVIIRSSPILSFSYVLAVIIIIIIMSLTLFNIFQHVYHKCQQQ